MIEFTVPENQLQGVLPSDLGHTLPQLGSFQLRDNNFSGPLPTSLSNASNLQILDLGGNSFTGKLLINFGLLKNFRLLLVGNNYLGSGEPDDLNFFASMTNCTIVFLSISANQFGGVLPNSIGNLSSHFRMLDLYENQISGAIPKEIGNLISLDTINLYSNRFTGSIPEEMGKLQNLQVLRLHGNSLSGRIPNSFGNLSQLNELSLSVNKLEGIITSSLGSCQKLATLNLSDNNLSGTIPEEIFGIPSLSISLNLARNKFSGTLSSKIGNLKNLGELDISENELLGEIPSSLSGCTSLENLNLAGNFFQGPIPLTLNALKGLQKIDLSRNNLSGQIPAFLENFQLKSLNLSFNNLEGEVPTQGVFLNASATDVAGNYRLCGGVAALNLPKCPSKASRNQKKSANIIIIISIGSVLLLLMVATFLLCWLKQRRGNKESSGEFGGKNFLQVSYATLFKATDGFSSANIVGLGSSGSVYGGTIDQYGTAVAIKVFNLQYQAASKSFAAECEALRNIRHRNLVKIITCCSSMDFQGNDFKALVYKFVPNGNLDRWLHPTLVSTGDGNRELQHLSLLQRINIATDVACALDYLHHHCEKPVVHCDLKPSNILLDNDMTAHVGDFGLAKFLPEMRKENESNSVGVRGTIGYAPPEYGLGSEVSTSGDVYSYGILLLEMVTGKRPTDSTFVEGLNLHELAKKALQEHILEIADRILLSADEDLASDTVEKCLICMTRVGVACSLDSPQERMDISNVIEELNFIRNTALGTDRFPKRKNV